MSDDMWKRYQKWKKEQGQHGKQAFARYMMLCFLDGLENTSDEFIFKGGNLLWHYIKTPRETTDLDLSTVTLRSHKEVKEQIENSFSIHHEASFIIKEFNEVDREDGVGARIIIGYKTNKGQKNQFQIDVVYALSTDMTKIKSTVADTNYKAATIENIIADKMDAAFRFGSGNTRIKDFDDLWRISKSDMKINQSKLNEFFSKRGLKYKLPLEWAEHMEDAWKAHVKKYKEVPNTIAEVFSEINEWLKRLIKS